MTPIYTQSPDPVLCAQSADRGITATDIPLKAVHRVRLHYQLFRAPAFSSLKSMFVTRVQGTSYKRVALFLAKEKTLACLPNCCLAHNRCFVFYWGRL